MSRIIGIALCVSLVVFIGATLVCRAVDAEVQQRVIFTRDGVTFDCERIFVPAGEVIPYEDGSSVVARAGGEVTYGDCHSVP
jgi:hypothetical protein